MTKDITKSELSVRKGWQELAEELLQRFPGVDRAELLKTMVAGCFFDMRHGNKREERAACDFLNEVQHQAVKQLEQLERNKTLVNSPALPQSVPDAN